MFSVRTIDLTTQVKRARGGPTANGVAAIHRARAATAGSLSGPENEAQVLDAAGVVLHRFRRLTHGGVTGRTASFRARPCEVDAWGEPLTPTCRVRGEVVGAETGATIAGSMFDSARRSL